MRLLHSPHLLQAIKRSIFLFHGSLFLPLILFSFICISFFFSLILPALCLCASALLLWKILFQFSVKLLQMIFMRLCLWLLDGKSKSVINGSNFNDRVEGIEEKQVSFELDPSEFPSFYVSKN